MLQLYDLNKNKIQGLTKYKDLKIESALSSGDKVLSFSYPKNLSGSIAEEGYVRTKTDEYVIKQIERNSDTYITVNCNLNLEELEGKVWESFSSKEQTIDSAIKLAIAGTGWTVKNNGVTKKRTIRKTGCSALEVIQQCIKTYHCEIQYDSINKIINIYDSIGSDKGCYFTDQLNLKELSIQSDSYDFYTIIEAYGKGDLHCTVENYQYSKKKKALYWKDERYTVLADLKEDATLKLKELSTPARAYKASIYDLARLSNKYKNILDYALGDIITLINKDTDTRLKQRIVKTVEYPDNPENNTVEISNTFASFEDMQKEQQETTETVSNITEDNGTISLKAMQDGWVELNKVNVQDLNAIRANIGTLNANEVIADSLHANKASINDLTANKANITDLTASNIEFGTAEGGTLDLQTLLARFVSGNNAQFLNLTGDNVVINEAVIKNIIAKNMSLDDLKSCKVTTSLMQFIDKGGNVRVQIGKDTTGNFTFILKGKDGKATLIDGDGIHEKAIADNLIVNRMIGENAVGSKQLDYESINNDGNTFKSSKIKFDSTGQTLDVAFNTLKSNVNNIKVGGRNLLKNTRDFTGVEGDSHIIDEKYNECAIRYFKNNNASSEFQKIVQWDNVFYPELGGVYTLSFWAKGTGAIDTYFHGATGYLRVEHFISSQGREATFGDGACRFDLTDNWKRYWVTYTLKNTGNTDVYKYVLFRHYSNSTSEEAYICGVKLERGHKATDWTPSPEDIQEQITSNTTKIGVNQGKIDTLIKDTTITKDGKNITLKDAYSSLEQNVNGFEAKVANAKTEAINTASTDATNKANKALNDSKDYTDNSVNTVIKRVTTAESSITQLSDSITQKVSKTEFESLQVGASNLLKNTRDFTGVSGESHVIDDKYNGCSVRYFVSDTTSEYQDIAHFSNVLYPELGGVYTLSFWAKGTGAIDTYFHGATGYLRVEHFISSQGYEADFDDGHCHFDLTDTWKRYWITYTLKETGNTNVYKHVLFRHFKSNTSEEIYLCGVKLEIGNKSTDWSPSPDDTKNQIDNATSRISTAESSITQLSNSITSKVTKADVESMISADMGKYKGDTNRLNVALFDQNTLNKGEYYKIYKQHGSSDSNSIVEVTNEYNIDDISSLKIQPSGIYSSNKVGIEFEAIDISKLGGIYPSFSVYVMPRTFNNSGIEIGFRAYNANGNEIHDFMSSVTYNVEEPFNNGTYKLKNNDWNRIYFAADEAMSDYNIVKIVPYIYAITESSTFYVCKPQLEILSEEEINKGEYMHEWTLGIKDMWKLFARVDTAEQKITPNAIISTVTSSTTYKNNLSNKVDTTTYESKIKQLSDNISSCVTKNGIGTIIEQNWEHVRIAWNNCSKYIQLEEGELNIYDKTANSLRFKLNDAGEHFWRDGYKVGKIGTNVWKQNNAHKGLCFDLEYQGKYMSFSERENSTDVNYTTIFTYSRANSIYTKEGLHFGKNCYMHNYTISDVELKNVSVDNTYAFTGNIPIVTKIEGDSHWTSTITVKYGIIMSAPKE